MMRNIFSNKKLGPYFEKMFHHAFLDHLEDDCNSSINSQSQDSNKFKKFRQMKGLWKTFKTISKKIKHQKFQALITGVK